MLDLLYVSHNRREFTEVTFATLLENTDWNHVNRLFVLDDRSTDGTYEHLAHAVRESPVPTTLTQERFGGPVAALNHALDRTKADVLGKIDNDTMLPPGWLDTLLAVLDANDHLDALGMEPGFAKPLGTEVPLPSYLPARHIGGQGLFGTRAFARRRPHPRERFFGMTSFMQRYMNCGWINPDIAAFNLDHVPEEPWQSLADEYVRKGWSRAWSTYNPSMRDYWAWAFDEVVA